MNEQSDMREDGAYLDLPIEQVSEGMKVMDRDGVNVGKVEYVEMGDPQAVTTEGNVPRETGGLFGGVAGAFGAEPPEPKVPEPKRSQLMRTGFIKIDGPGILDKDRYASGEWIAGVSDNTVTLSVPKDQLIEEGV
ncbi:MAG TPA: hypothetical protein VFE42_27500 [Chloroflexota bacterium]|nr:hypothetical protein [Chloroflexota bacterium]